MQAKIPIETLAQVNYIDPAEAKFYIEGDNFLCLDYKGETYKNIKLHRALPFGSPDDFVSVQDIESKELFLIRSLYELTEEQALLCSKELKKRYFCPSVTAIPALKNKMGYLYFDVRTNAGPKTFALRDVTRSIRRIEDGARIILVDVDGNRYQIDDVSRLSRADFKRLEPYLL